MWQGWREVSTSFLRETTSHLARTASVWTVIQQHGALTFPSNPLLSSLDILLSFGRGTFMFFYFTFCIFARGKQKLVRSSFCYESGVGSCFTLLHFFSLARFIKFCCTYY